MALMAVRCLVVSLTAFALLITGLIIRTLLIQRPVSNLKPCGVEDVDFIPLGTEAIGRFRTGLRMQTVSLSPGNQNVTELDRLVNFIIESYPTLHSSSQVTWRRVANYSLLYHVRGLNQNLRPYLLMAHLDVVPVVAEEWDWPPFGAEIHDGFVYARGTIDDKHSVFGILEAVEFVLKKKLPQRSFYIAFGHDEEVNGLHGALVIAKKLQETGVEFEYIIDEGLTVTKNIVPFVDKLVALVGVSEKGYLGLKLRTNVTGGHSSMPGKESSIGILANAVSRLEANPLPSMLGTGPEVGLLECIASETPFPIQVVLSNLWLFGPLVSRILSESPLTNALIRTTMAVTMFNAGVKENVLPSYAEVIINHRIHPSQSISEVFAYDQRIVNDDRIQFEIVHFTEAHSVSGYGADDFGFQTISSTISQIWGQNEILVVPGLLMGNTDTRHFLNLSKNIYRFSPAVLEKDDVKRFHGVNERISLKNFEQIHNFYYHLIMNSDVEDLSSTIHRKSAHEDF